jgi:hypothetical protein
MSETAQKLLEQIRALSADEREWLAAELTDGTRKRVVKGSVLVRDLLPWVLVLLLVGVSALFLLLWNLQVSAAAFDWGDH